MTTRREVIARYRASQPPSTGSVWPVIIAAASLARNTIAAATSSASTSRPSGVASISAFAIAGSAISGSTRRVRTKAGATALTRMPCGAHSSASARVRLTSAPLTGVIGRIGIEPAAGEPHDRGDVDDGAGPPRHHVPADGAGAVEGAVEPDVEDALPALARHVDGRDPRPDAGIVDEHVEAPEASERLSDGRIHLALIRDIDRGGQGRTAALRDLLGHGPRRRRVDVRHRDGGAERGESHRRRPPDAGPGAGDEDGTAAEVQGVLEARHRRRLARDAAGRCPFAAVREALRLCAVETPACYAAFANEPHHAPLRNPRRQG